MLPPRSRVRNPVNDPRGGRVSERMELNPPTPPLPDAVPDAAVRVRWGVLAERLLENAPVLIGSKRQIHWATELRARAALRAGQILDADQTDVARANADDRPAVEARYHEDLAIFQAIFRTRSAIPWIESRASLPSVLAQPASLRHRRLTAWEFELSSQDRSSPALDIQDRTRM